MSIRNVGVAALLLVVSVGVAPRGCAGDPNDPRTWGKKLKNLRDQKEALDRIANFDVEKARIVVPELVELYKDTKKPEHLERWPLSGRAHQAPHDRGPRVQRG